MKFDKMNINTKALYIGGEITRKDILPESTPIYQTSSYIMDSLDMLYERYDDGGFTYSRLSNPNRSGLEEAISHIENGKYTFCFSSGMASITTGLLTVLKSGDHVIANSALYGETIQILTEVLNEYNIEASFIDFDKLSELEKSIRPNTKLLYTEILSNPLVNVTDIVKVVEIAKRANIKVMVDNTFTTPFLIRPIEYGVDIVVNSVTKALNGHFDVTGGVLSTNDIELAKRVETLITLMGSVMDPNSAWLTLRGLRTAPLRIAEQNKNARELAKLLKEHSKIKKVFHPSLKDHKGYTLAKQLFDNNMYGSMLSIEVEDDMKYMNKLVKGFNLVRYANTLGGYRTTLSHPVSSSHLTVSEEKCKAVGIHSGILRVSCGIENIEDLMEDFTRAFDSI